MTTFRQQMKKFALVRWLKDLPGMKLLYIFLVYALLRRPFLSRRLTIGTAEGVPFDIDYTFGLNGYESFGDRHNAGFRRWLNDCAGTKTVFDVGAHIGLYSLPAGKVLAGKGKIFAFEPAAANVAMFRRHLLYNKLENVTVIQMLVGEESRQQVDFFECARADAMNALEPLKDKARYERVARQQVCLDDFCVDNDVWPEVVKIDVEGAEVKVLRGARALMRKTKPLIYLSVHPKRIKLLDDTLEDLAAVISENGYTIKDFSGRSASARDLEFGEYLLVPASTGKN